MSPVLPTLNYKALKANTIKAFLYKSDPNDTVFKPINEKF